MAQVAYVMLAHEEPSLLAVHAALLTSADPAASVVIHYDASQGETKFKQLQELAAALPRVTVIETRARCAWGEFGLVEGVLFALRDILRQRLEPDYVYLISGSCLPTRPLQELNSFLDDNQGTEFIQSQDESWMKGGLRQERFQFFFPVNFRTRRKLFDALVKAQRRVGVRRKIPGNLEARFGSQWWCLTWDTCKRILAYIDENPDFVRFYRSTWIPDESFFQTLAFHLAGDEIANTSLTLHQFTNKGKPIVFYDDHEVWLFAQNFFFARKISPEAAVLKRKIAEVAAGPARPTKIHDVGRVTPFYAAAIWVREKRERPGQLFRTDQRRDSYPGALAKNTRPYVALFGPAAATRIAATALRAEGCTVLGRIFHPEQVGLNDYGVETPGLAPDDVEMRDFCPSLYLSRVIDRVPGMPVFEQTLADSPAATYLAYDDPNCLFIGCLPWADQFGPVGRWDTDRWRYFAALGLLGAEVPAQEAAWADLIEAVGDETLWDYEFERLMEAYSRGEVLSWVRQKGFADLEKRNFLLLPPEKEERGRQPGQEHAPVLGQIRAQGDGAGPRLVPGLSSEADVIRRIREFLAAHPEQSGGLELERGVIEAAKALRTWRLSDMVVEMPSKLAERLLRLAARVGIADEPRPSASERYPVSVVEPARRVI